MKFSKALLILEKIGVGEKWIKWIEWCIFTARFLILIVFIVQGSLFSLIPLFLVFSKAVESQGEGTFQNICFCLGAYMEKDPNHSCFYKERMFDDQ